MKSQNFRSYKANGSGSSNPGAGHHGPNSRFNGHYRDNDPSNAVDASAVNDKLLDLLAKSLGKQATATVSSGARYQGLLQAADLTALGSGAVSVALYKPVLVSKALIDEKSNSDGSLPEKLVIQAKDLIDIDVSTVGRVDKFDKSEDKPQPQEKLEEKPQLKPQEKPKAATSKEGSAPLPEKSFARVAAEAVPGKLRERSKLAEKSPAPQANAPDAKNAQSKKPAAKPFEKVKPLEKPLEKPRSASPSKSPSPATRENQRFRTDKDISSSFQVRERELQRWVPDDDLPALSLEESTDTGAPWDQFKVNEEKFGVESSYDEHLYTTKINTSAKDFKERVRRAERLAKEIEGQSTEDRHVLEERGIVVDDSGLDEEDKYSGVIKEKADQRGSELMAALKNVSISSDSQSGNSNVPPPKPGSYSTPRQRAANYHNDPAIISSSATRKVHSPSVAQKNPPTDAMSSQSQETPAPTETNRTQTKPSSIPPKPPVPAENNELFRLNAQSEINALREFSANFRVPHKMPNDLLPILAKDKLKQDEILKKLDPAKKLASPGTSGDGKKEGGKPSFKLNPKAAVFTPSQKLSENSPIPSKAYFASSGNPSPRVRHQRPHFSDRPSSGKRHHKVSAADFFGGSDKVPTAPGQKEKIERFRSSFNMFNTAQKKHKETNDGSSLVLEKAFHTPPTWDSTVEENYSKLLMLQTSPAVKSPPMMMPHPMMPMFPTPVMGVPGASPTMGAPANPKFSMSPLMQGQQVNMAAQFQQQQQQLQAAAMMYQFQGAPPGAPQFIYTPPGVEPQFLPPGGFVVPGGYVGSGSPQSGNMMMGGSPHLGAGGPQGGYKNHPYQGNRRYNGNSQGKRGNNNA